MCVRRRPRPQGHRDAGTGTGPHTDRRRRRRRRGWRSFRSAGYFGPHRPAWAAPPPRTGLVDRTLIAAYTGGLFPILCLTKTDLAPAAPFAEQFADLDLAVIIAGRDDPLDAVAHLLAGKITVLLGHSGVGKSTLVNRLVPEADRAVGEVTDIGRGRQPSTQSVALPLNNSGR